MRNQSFVGALFALLAFGAWGFNPVYFKAVAGIPTLEVLAHRVIWAAPLLFILLLLAGTWKNIFKHLADRRTLLLLLVCALILSANWLIYIWAIANDRVLESSLGYFMNPLMNVVLGVAVLKERISPVRMFAVVLAAAGVINLTVQGAGFPWIGLSLAGLFAVYGLIRKTLPVGSREGLFIETSFMFIPALIMIGYFAWNGTAVFLNVSWELDLLLVAAGAVTALPLIWFASAARRLNYSTVGFFQYIAPSSQFLLAVFMYGEPFTSAHMVTFGCIWVALVIFTTDSLAALRRKPA